MGGGKENNLGCDQEYYISNIKEELSDALKYTDVYGEDDNLRKLTIARALGFDPETGEIKDNIRVESHNGKARAIVKMERYVPNSNIDRTNLGLSYETLEKERNRCLANIVRFNMDYFMDLFPVLFEIK